MQQISEKIVEGLPIPPKGNKVHFFSGSTLQGKKAPAGFGVRVTAAGTKAFVLFHRVDGTKHLETLGRWDANPQGGTLTVRDAIVAADKRIKAIAKGTADDHRPERTRRLEDGDTVDGLTVGGMLDDFISKYARKKLRSADQYASTFDRLIKPDIGDIGIYDLRRRQVAEMLDEIAGESGEVMADRALAYFRKACNWFAGRDDDFVSPIVKGMRETTSNNRDRVLDEQELRDLWAGLAIVENVPACYPRFVKSLLLNMNRRNEAARMHSAEVDGDLWTIPGERYKRLPKHAGLDHVIPMSRAALALIGAKPDGARRNSWFVFSSSPDGEKPFSGFSKAKRELDKAITKVRAADGRGPMDDWCLHDLRRTARTLMSAAGVSPDHAERCLGHIIGGVRGVYDRFEFADEKRAAFEALAQLVDKILQPVANVEELAAHRVPA
jgi:integrase